MKNPSSYRGYSRHYSDTGFWKKVVQLPQQSSEKLLSKAIILWVLLTAPTTPKAVRIVLAGVLGYVILTLDLCPDFIPGVGWSDDLAAVVGAIAYANDYVTPQIEAKASRKLAALMS